MTPDIIPPEAPKPEIPKKRAGRPKGAKGKKEWSAFELKVVAKLAEAQCTYEEIGQAIGITGNRFAQLVSKKGIIQETYIKAKASGKSNIRMKIYSRAKFGDMDALKLLAGAWFSKDIDWQGLDKTKGPSVVNNNNTLNLTAAKPDPKIIDMAARLALTIGNTPKEITDAIEVIPEAKPNGN